MGNPLLPWRLASKPPDGRSRPGWRSMRATISSQANLGTFKAAIPGLAEVSIGHALIGEALYEGLATTVRNYLQILR